LYCREKHMLCSFIYWGMQGGGGGGGGGEGGDGGSFLIFPIPPPKSKLRKIFSPSSLVFLLSILNDAEFSLFYLSILQIAKILIRIV